MADNNKTIDELLYDVAADIEPRKKNPLIPIIVLIAGIVCISLPSTGVIDLSPNLSSALLFVGFVIALTGFIMLIMSIKGKGVPYYKPSGEQLRRYELVYDHNLREKVNECVCDGDFESLTDLPRGESSAIKAVVFKTAGDEIVIAQAMEYVPHYYRPLSDVKVFRKGEYIRSAKLD